MHLHPHQLGEVQHHLNLHLLREQQQQQQQEHLLVQVKGILHDLQVQHLKGRGQSNNPEPGVAH
jgi:hypothetical protein